MGQTESPTVLPGDSLVPLESVLCTEELNLRPSRPPDYETENHALVTLVQALADSPQTIFKKMAEIMLEAFRADSSGFSLLTQEDGGKRFYWPAIAGVWKPHIGGGTPRDFGPCGDVLDRNTPLLFKHFERRYPYFLPVTPLVEECLLAPFYVEGKAVGTIWVIAHDERRKFDAEDLRQLVSLGRFASSAYQALAFHEKTLAMNEALTLGSVRQHALTGAAASANVQLQMEIGERKKAEASLREAAERKNEFLAMLAHELRNPLAPIRFALEIVKRADGDDDLIKPALDTIERQVRQMTRLIDDLFDVSRITRDKLQLRREEVELASVIHHVVEAARSACDAAQHELTVTLPPQQVYLHADPVRLAQVFGNLLHNACKFTKPGGRIALAAERQGNEVVVTVRDSGVGIRSDTLPKIFEMFTQGDQTLERIQGGLGIGLTLTRRLVEMHGGSVQAFSEGVGRGSEFVVHLPAMIRKPKGLSPDPTVGVPLTARRILVVDDNHDAANALSVLLKVTGNETHLAFDGVEAVEVAASFRPDVILMDIGMPKMNGYDAARRIREQPWGKDMALVALTGWGQDEDRKKTADAGFDGHLVKPVDYAELTKMLAGLPKKLLDRA